MKKLLPLLIIFLLSCTKKDEISAMQPQINKPLCVSYTLSGIVMIQGLMHNKNKMNEAMDSLGYKWGKKNADVVDIELRMFHGGMPPVVYSNVVVNVRGEWTVTLPNYFNGQYWIHVIHRNSISIWSDTTVNFGNGSVVYDFTEKCYMNNQYSYQGTLCMYAGDCSRDGVPDQLDCFQVYQKYGRRSYIPEDINGDGIVDFRDSDIIYENFKNGVYEINPN
jgi:hypothetical protein